MSYRLLVVPGDNQVLRSLPGQLAEDVTIEICETSNAALWEVRMNPPQALVADTNLPDMSGLDLAEILANFGVPTRVILWSRIQDRRAEKQAARHGVHSFLSGVIAQDELRTLLNEAVRVQVEPAAVLHDAEPATVAHEPEPLPPEVPPALEPPLSSSENPLASESPAQPRPSRFAAAAARAAERREAGEEASYRPAPRRNKGDGPLVLTSESLTPIRNLLTDLGHDLGTQCIMLTDRAGMTLVEVGDQYGLPMVIVLPLLSTSFSTAGEVARQLREEESTNLYMHEGNNYDLYCFDVMQRFLLVLVFNKKTSVSKMGIVWGMAKRAIKELNELLS